MDFGLRWVRRGGARPWLCLSGQVSQSVFGNESHGERECLLTEFKLRSEREMAATGASVFVASATSREAAPMGETGGVAGA